MRVYFLLRPIDLTTTFCLSHWIPCVHSIPCWEMFCRWSSGHKVKCVMIPFFAIMTRPTCTLPPCPAPPDPKHTFKKNPRFWETRDQPQPGSLLNDNADPGKEVELRPDCNTWISVHEFSNSADFMNQGCGYSCAVKTWLAPNLIGLILPMGWVNRINSKFIVVVKNVAVAVTVLFVFFSSPSFLWWIDKNFNQNSYHYCWKFCNSHIFPNVL